MIRIQVGQGLIKKRGQFYSSLSNLKNENFISKTALSNIGKKIATFVIKDISRWKWDKKKAFNMELHNRYAIKIGLYLELYLKVALYTASIQKYKNITLYQTSKYCCCRHI